MARPVARSDCLPGVSGRTVQGRKERHAALCVSKVEKYQLRNRSKKQVEREGEKKKAIKIYSLQK